MQRHDRVAKFIHWTLRKNCNLTHSEKWHEKTPQPVIESTEVTILCDFIIHTDRKNDGKRPDIIIKYHREKTCIMLDRSLQIKIFFLKNSRSFLDIKFLKFKSRKCGNIRPNSFKL